MPTLNAPRLLISGCLVCAAMPASAGIPSWIRRLDQQVIKRIQISGYRTLGLHLHQVSGDREAYNTLNYYGQGQRKFTDIGQITLTGRKVLGIANFDATILDSRLTDPQGQRFSLNYEKSGFAVDIGDVNGTLLNTNLFASYRKSLRGVQTGYRKGRFQAKAVYSQVRGSARTISIPGTNSPGPYYLQNNQILRGTEEVQVDGVPQRVGEDYIIDYEVGSITFLKSSIVPSSSIVVSYEALGTVDRPGTLQAAGVAYDMGRVGRVGVTAMRQLTGSGSATTQRLEKFQGFGASSTPYFLQFEPLPGSTVEIRVNGILQRQGIDYVFDASNPAVFYFTRFMPATDNIDVLYRPTPRTTVDGDREVLGVDYRLPLGDKGSRGYVSLHQATGRLTKSPSATSGTARGAQLQYSSGPLLFSANWRKVPPGFVGIETTGFNRNEDAHDARLEFRPTSRWTFAASETNRSIRTPGTLPRTYVNSRVVSTVGTALFRPSETSRWEANHRRSKTTGIAGDSRVEASTLTASQIVGPMRLNMGLERTDGYGTSGGKRTNFRILGAKLGAAFEYRNVLSTSLSYGINHIRSGSTSGIGRDVDLNLTVRPGSWIDVSARYLLSDSGSVVTIGSYNNGYGLGYDGNGFSGGSGATSLLGATNLELLSGRVAMRPAPRLTMNVEARRYKTVGSVSSNATTSGIGGGLTYDLGSNTRLDLSVDRSNTSYVDSPLRSGTTSLTVGLAGNPKGRFNYALSSSSFRSTGNSTFRQNSGSFDLTAGYYLGGRHRLVLDFSSGRTSGYLPQNATDLLLGYQYQIWNNLALQASYRYRNVKSLDPTIVSGQYKSSGMDLELVFRFGF